MNLLSEVDWQAEDRRARLHEGYLPATDVLRIVSSQELLPGVTGFDLEDDPRLGEELSQSGLWVGEPAQPFEDVVYLEPAPTPEDRPSTWREVHQLDDGRCLTLPGERLHERTLSFWQEGHEFDPRPTVVSLTVDAVGRISGFARWRRRKCVETPNANGTCRGGDAKCRCEVRQGLSGRVVIDICKCSRT